MERTMNLEDNQLYNPIGATWETNHNSTNLTGCTEAEAARSTATQAVSCSKPHHTTTYINGNNKTVNLQHSAMDTGHFNAEKLCRQYSACGENATSENREALLTEGSFNSSNDLSSLGTYPVSSPCTSNHKNLTKYGSRSSGSFTGSTSGHPFNIYTTNKDRKGHSSSSDSSSSGGGTRQRSELPYSASSPLLLQPEQNIPSPGTTEDTNSEQSQTLTMNRSIGVLARHLTRGLTDPVARFRVIFSWVATNVEYDVTAFLQGGHAPSRDVETGSEALRTRKATCSGYSDLLQRMCSSCGIECVKIWGHAKGAGYIPGQPFSPSIPNHEWNAVQLNAHWYLVDVCWSAGYLQQSTQTFVFKLSNHYFLSDPEIFIMDHLPLDPKWQLLPVSSRKTLEDFERGVHLKQGYFQHDVSSVIPEQGLSEVTDGHVQVTLTFPYPLTLTYELRHLPSGEEYSKCVSFRVDSSKAEFFISPVLQGPYTFKVYGKVKGCQEEPVALTTHTFNVSVTSIMSSPWRDLRFPWGPTRHLLDIGLEEMGPSCSCLLPTTGVGLSHNRGLERFQGDNGEFTVSFCRSKGANVNLHPVLYELTGNSNPRRCASSASRTCEVRENHVSNEGVYGESNKDHDELVIVVRPPSEGHYWLAIYASNPMSEEKGKCVANYLICTMDKSSEASELQASSNVPDLDTRWQHNCQKTASPGTPKVESDSKPEGDFEYDSDIYSGLLQSNENHGDIQDKQSSDSISVYGFSTFELIPVRRLAQVFYLMCAKIGYHSQRSCTRFLKYMIE